MFFVGIISIKISMFMENEKKFGVNNLFFIIIVYIVKWGILIIYCLKRNYDFELVLMV